METRLNSIDELFHYSEIKEYITINRDHGNTITNHKIKRIFSKKPNYQLFTENSGVITLAYSHIPDYLNFYVVNNRTLIKVISSNNVFETNISDKSLSINIKLINDEYDCDEDEETVDTCFED